MIGAPHSTGHPHHYVYKCTNVFTGEPVNLVVLYEASLDENEPVGLLIHKFKCGTQQQQPACRFYLNTCNKPFNIDENGELCTESSLDRELKAAY